MRSLCIDLGSTFVKFFVHEDTQVIYQDQIRFPDACVDDGVRYLVPIRSIDELIKEIFAGAMIYEPQKCFLSVQMHGYVLRNPDGTFEDYVSWKDQTADMDSLFAKQIDFYSNGTRAKNNLPLLKLVNDPAAKGSTFYTLGSYIVYRLTGQNVTHKTDGCASGFFDADTLKPVDILPELTLPRVTHEIKAVGKYDSVEIYTPIGDHQISFLGSGAADDSILLNIGTATQISVLGSEKPDNPAIELRPYFGTVRLLTISGLTGGGKLYQGYDRTAFFEEIAEVVDQLPQKKRILVGGGGAKLIFDELKQYMSQYGKECVMAEGNIGMNGLMEISHMCEQTEKKLNIGIMLSEVCFSNFPVIIKDQNLDFCIVDCEHGAFDYSFLSGFLMTSRLAGLPVIIRLPDNSRRDITRLVDMGADGFLLPMTNTPEDIRQVVQYAKYAPIGQRGISTNRAHTLYNPPEIEKYMVSANQRVKVYAQIETRMGVEHVKEILSETGVDGIFVGPNDLSCDLGCVGQYGPVKEAMEIIAAKAKECNKPWGIITTSKDLIDFSLEHEVDFISYGSEINLLKDGCKKIRKMF